MSTAPAEDGNHPISTAPDEARDVVPLNVTQASTALAGVSFASLALVGTLSLSPGGTEHTDPWLLPVATASTMLESVRFTSDTSPENSSPSPADDFDSALEEFASLLRGEPFSDDSCDPEMAELLEAAARASAETKKLQPEEWAELIVSSDDYSSDDDHHT